MEVDVKNLDAERKLMAEKKAKLSSFEKSEFERRVNLVINAKQIKRRLIKQKNIQREAFNAVEKKRNKQSLIVSIVVLIALALNSFTTFLKGENIYLAGFLGAVLFILNKIETEVFDSKYFILQNTLQLEIDRYENETKQFGYLFLVNIDDLFFEYEGEDQLMSDKFGEKANEAYIELENEIFKTMFVN
jgi:hypothetical protein